MRPHDDLLDSLREELRLTPSASFDAAVRARIEAEPVGRGNLQMTLVAAVSAAAMIVAGAVGYLPWGDRGPEAADPVRLTADIPTPVVPARQPEMPEETLPSRPVLRAVPPPVSAPSFDPFTDVVIDVAEQRGFARLVTYSAADPLPVELKPLSIDEPVQVVALNKPTPLEIPLLDIRRQAGTSDGQTR